MNILAHYEHILAQALEEIGPLDVPESDQQALAQQGELAPQLADVIFRLTVEHGIPFGPFQETVISILVGQKSALVTTGGGSPPRRFGAGLEGRHSLILLALEMMPTDSFDHI